MRNFFNFNKQQFLVLQLNNERRSDFIDAIFGRLRDSYIPRQKVLAAKRNGQDIGELLSTFFPDVPALRSGEFGEVLTFLLLPSKTGLNLVGPNKWKWKEDKNIPLKKTDVLLFEVGAAPSEYDVLVSAEVKSKATNANSSPILSAITGAKKDRAGRIARSLIWLKDKAIQENDTSLRATISRFLESDRSENGSYQKHIKAVVVVDHSLLSAELAKIYPSDCHDDLEIIVISVEDLRGMYNAVFDKAINDHGAYDD